MLIVLLGAGNGLMNALLGGSQSISINTMMVGGGRTSEAYAGLQSGRNIRIEAKDAELIMRAFPDVVDNVSVTVSVSQNAVYQDNALQTQEANKRCLFS